MAVTWCLAFLLSVTPATRETVNETPPAPVNVLSIIFNLFWAVFVFTVDASGWLAGPALQLAAMFLGGPVFTTLVNFFVVVDSDFWIPPVFSRARTILGMGRGVGSFKPPNVHAHFFAFSNQIPLPTRLDPQTVTPSPMIHEFCLLDHDSTPSYDSARVHLGIFYLFSPIVCYLRHSLLFRRHHVRPSIVVVPLLFVCTA
ncbi:hypothetical protein BDR04DRAFT_1091937 [Suillus decipiens]|nr:hypothetical protein BDR04DRAFT_1091937 [Suillus decipiens]